MKLLLVMKVSYHFLVCNINWLNQISIEIVMKLVDQNVIDNNLSVEHKSFHETTQEEAQENNEDAHKKIKSTERLCVE